MRRPASPPCGTCCASSTFWSWCACSRSSHTSGWGRMPVTQVCCFDQPLPALPFSLAFWLLWSDYCHPFLVPLKKKKFFYYSGTSYIRYRCSPLSLAFWLLWSDYHLSTFGRLFIYIFLITAEPAISGTHAWDWHKIMVKEKGSMMDASAKYLIQFVRLVLFLNVSFVFDQKRMILLCLTRRERFCFVWPKENDSVCCIWPEENASVLTVNASNRQRPPRPGQQHEGLCWSSGCKYALSSLLNCSLASVTAACFQYHCSTD